MTRSCLSTPDPEPSRRDDAGRRTAASRAEGAEGVPATSATNHRRQGRSTDRRRRYEVQRRYAKPGGPSTFSSRTSARFPKWAMYTTSSCSGPTTKVVDFNTAAASARDTDFIPAAIKRGRPRHSPDPARPSTSRRQSPRGGGVSLHVHLPRALHRRHEGEPGRQVARSHVPATHQ